jgi:hypothetical protein
MEKEFCNLQSFFRSDIGPLKDAIMRNDTTYRQDFEPDHVAPWTPFVEYR